MTDRDNQAMIIRGPGVAIPPDSNLGHFHIGNDEFWFILEGKIDYQIEDVGVITADPGDIVFVPPGRWHRASWHRANWHCVYLVPRQLIPRPAGTHPAGTRPAGTVPGTRPAGTACLPAAAIMSPVAAARGYSAAPELPIAG